MQTLMDYHSSDDALFELATLDCPLDEIQEAAARIFPHDEASQTDMISHAWERWSRNGVRDVALLIHAGKHYAYRMRRRERSPLSCPLDEAAELVAPRGDGQVPQEVIERLPAHLQLLAVLLASGYSQTECATTCEVSPATIHRRCREIAAHLRPLYELP